MQKSLFRVISEFLFGYKYYTPIYHHAECFDAVMHGGIFKTKREAEQILLGNTSFILIEVVSFRSREIYEDGEIK